MPVPDGPEALDPNFRIELPNFEGPLDLLLHLIRKHELDILDLPVAFITDKYLEYLGLMQGLNLDIASEYLVMAATLAHIKSKMLLPRVPEDQDDEDADEVDPRAELIRRLLEYQKYKRAAEELAGMPVLYHDIFVRPEGKTETDIPMEEPFIEATIFQLMDAFQSVLTEADRRTPVEVTRESFTLEEGIDLIVSRLTDQPSASFNGLFSGLDSRRKIITVFLSLLELIRRGRLIAVQADYGEPISLVLNGEPPESRSLNEEQGGRTEDGL